MKNSTLYRLVSITATVLAALSSAMSCKTDNTPSYSTYMTAVRDSAQGPGEKVSYLVTDDSIKIFPANDLLSLSSLKNDQRVFAVFTIPSGEITNPMEAEFSTVSLLTQDTIANTSETSGKGSPVFINAAWHSGGIYGAGRFLTLSFIFKGAGYVPHRFELSDEANVLSNPDPSGYYHLTFKHYNSNEPDAYQYSGVITYPLTEKYTAGIKGLKIRFEDFDPESPYGSVTVNY